MSRPPASVLPAVVHEDRDLLVVAKPSGVPTTSPGGRDSLTTRLEAARREALHPTSRLDADVTGLVTYARTKRAIAALKEARARGRYDRLYVALTERAPSPGAGTWDAAIAIDPRDRRLRVAVAEGGAGERLQRAQTTYETVGETPHGARLHLRPHTGRTHQLRVHAAHAGVPLLGDVRYGGAKRVTLEDGRVVTIRRPMLHCARLVLPRVSGDGELTLELSPPDDFEAAWRALGGAPDQR